MSEDTISRREMIAAVISAAALPLVSACGRSREPMPTTPNETGALALLDEVADNLLRLRPEQATSLGIDTGARAALRSCSPIAPRRASGVWRTNCGWISIASRPSTRAASRTRRAPASRSCGARTRQRSTVSRFRMATSPSAAGATRRTSSSRMSAPISTSRASSIADHRIESAADAEAYLARLQSYAKQLDGELERMKAARAAGLVPPAFLIDKAVRQMTLAAKNARNGGSLVESHRAAVEEHPRRLGGRARTIVVQEIAPALERQIGELEAQRSIATNDAGIAARPHGEEFYRWALKASTTTTMSPDEIHELGQSEVKRLHAQMDAILKEIGYSKGTVGERMKALANDPRYKFAEGDKGRAEIMAFINDRLAWIRAQMPRAFNTVVESEHGSEATAARGGARRARPRTAARGRSMARSPVGCGSTSGPRSCTANTAWRTSTFHEAIPGHIWQGEYTHQMPLIRQMLDFNAYSEGWALYAEQLADELGAYADDRVGRLGYLQSLAFRACRLVVDTGIHAKRWTREQGVQYFVDINGSNPLEVASEVDRYCSWPGQACGYKVGHSEINRQREKATAALGAKFDLKAFNDTVVRGGNVPLDVLAKNVGRVRADSLRAGAWRAAARNRLDGAATCAAEPRAGTTSVEGAPIWRSLASLAVPLQLAPPTNYRRSMIRTSLLATLGFVTVARIASSQVPTPSLVEVGGRKVNVQVAGTARPGAPTVVFESGFGSQVATWNGLQSDIAAVTRTIAYDRAGVGKSDPATTQRTVKQIATELHDLLAKLNAPPPYVLVGHSYGGPIIHTFGAMFPREVVGLVYIDPTDFIADGSRYASDLCEGRYDERPRRDRKHDQTSAGGSAGGAPRGVSGDRARGTRRLRRVSRSGGSAGCADEHPPRGQERAACAGSQIPRQR